MVMARLLKFLVAIGIFTLISANETGKFEGFISPLINEVTRNFSHRQDVKYYQVKAASFRFASYYQDHMVIQRGLGRTTVWGYAPLTDLGKVVKVTVTSTKVNEVYMAKVEKGPFPDSAVWRTKLGVYSASNASHTIQASLDPHQPISISDVIIGDVWVCSGQSNMAFSVSQMFNSSEEYAMAHLYPHVRLLQLSRINSTKTLYDIVKYDIDWSLPSQRSIESFSAVCWLYGRHVNAELGVPMGLIVSAWGGTAIETWSSPRALHHCGLQASTQANESPSYYDEDKFVVPSGKNVLWNAMIHPLINMTIYGVLWYQGEANVAHDRDQYNCSFPAMISDWREEWQEGSQGETHPLFPVGFVQLGPNNKNFSKVVTQGYSDIRWHLTADRGYVPNTALVNVFMATAVDMADPNSPYAPVHYRDKGTVGARLSLAGLSVAYQVKGLKFQGPWPSNVSFDLEFGLMTLTYDLGTTPLNIKDTAGFELCCRDKREETCSLSGTDWSHTVITSHTNISITLTLYPCRAGQYVMGLRYLWRETPCKYKTCAVYSVENDLPAPPISVRQYLAGPLNRTPNI